MTITLNSFSPNTKIKSADINTNFQNLSDHIRPTFVFTLDQYLSVGANQTPVLIVPLPYTIEKVYAIVKTAPVGAAIICDIQKNGTSIWTTQANRVTIAAGATTATPVTAFDTTALVEGDQLTLDIDQVGSTTAGTSLTVLIKCS